MIIVDNIVANAKQFILTGSIIALVNLLAIVTLLVMICYYIKYYRPTNTMLIEDLEILDMANTCVKSLQVVKSAIVYHWKMPVTETFSHWNVVVHLVTGVRVLLSSSMFNNVHVRIFDKAVDGYDKLIYKKPVPVVAPNTTKLKDVINFEQLLITETTYGYNIFNCHDVVYTVMKRFCMTQMHKPVKNLKLMSKVFEEL